MRLPQTHPARPDRLVSEKCRSSPRAEPWGILPNLDVAHETCRARERLSQACKFTYVFLGRDPLAPSQLWYGIRVVTPPPLESQRVFILAVDPSPERVDEIRAALDESIPVRWARDVDAALESDRSHRWLGVVVGPSFEGAEGLELAKRLVSHSSADVAAAWIATDPSVEMIRDASQHAITTVLPPVNEASMTSFREQCHLRRQPAPTVARLWAARNLAQEHHLTAREIDVLELLLEGNDVGRIATRFAIAEKTAQHHVSSILRKTGATRSRQLMVRALHIAQAACVEGMPLADLTPQIELTSEQIRQELARRNKR